MTILFMALCEKYRCFWGFMDFYQPEGSYRFSSDAVCAARFACSLITAEMEKKSVRKKYLIMDIGCGCGVIGILVLQFFKELYPGLYPYLQVIGVEKEEALYQAAKYNAKIFGHEKNYFAFQTDIARAESVGLVQKFALETVLLDRLPEMLAKDGGELKNPRMFDMVITNPPWYRAESKLHSVSALRNTALFGSEDVLQTFFSFGEKFLKKNSSLLTVAKTACFMEFLQAFPKSVQPVAMQPVYKTMQDKAVFFVLQGKYQSRAVFEVTAPVSL